MTHRRLSIALLVAAWLAAACGRGASPERAVQSATAAVVATDQPSGARVAYPITVASSDGRSVTLTKRAERIVSLSPGNTESFFAISAGGQLVGVDRFSDYPAAAQALPKIDYSNPNVEAVAALRPDLVLLSNRQRTLVPVLEGAGLKVLLLEEPATVRAVLERITLQGQLTDHPREAAALVATMRARIDAVTERVQGLSGPRVYHELDPKLFSAAPSSFVGDFYTLLNARNIAPAGGAPFPQLTSEAIIAADPEVIVLTAAEFPGGSVADAKKRPGWSTLSAVRSDRVYALSGDLLSRPGPRLVDGLEALAKVLYPDIFR